MSAADRDVLRHLLGDAGYRDVETAGDALDRLAARGTISAEWLTDMLAALADEIIVQAVANDVARELTEPERAEDTRGSEATS